MSSFPPPVGSVLDTNRNIASISSTKKDARTQADKQYKSYLTSLYRVMNLSTADMIESLAFGCNMRQYRKLNRVEKDRSRAKLLGVTEATLRPRNDHDKELLKAAVKGNPDGYLFRTTMDLRKCSHLVSMARDDEGNEFINGTSDKCRNKYCFICNRAKSQKFTGRFVKLIEEKFSDFDKYRFYFLTLTLVHNSKVRRGDYLAELKGYVGKLFRSKMFKNNIRPPHGHDKIGTIRSYENKVGDNGNHIHVHILIMCDKVGKVKLLEQKIRSWWKTKTLISNHQSNQVRFDLIGKGLASGDWSGFLGSVREVMKYSTKFNDTNKITSRELSTFGDWMKSSKGKNFKNATGLFSGYQLTSHKSKLDDKPDEELEDKPLTRYIASATGLKYYSTKKGEINLKKKYDKNSREEMKDSMSIIGGEVYELNEVYDELEMRELLNQKSLMNVAEMALELNQHKEELRQTEEWAVELNKKRMLEMGLIIDDDGFITQVRKQKV